LNFAVNHIIRKDPEMKKWHKKIKNRRGTKIARVAVMRKLTTIIWHMLRWDKPYQFRYETVLPQKKTKAKGKSSKGFQGINISNPHEEKTKTPLKDRCKTTVRSRA
jgi:hypothetical protein